MSSADLRKTVFGVSLCLCLAVGLFFYFAGTDKTIATESAVVGASNKRGAEDQPIQGQPETLTVERANNAVANEEADSNFQVDVNSAEDYFSLHAHTLYLTYPETPGAVYEKHIEHANLGRAESMYWVAVALSECEFAGRVQTEKEKGNSQEVGRLLNTLHGAAKAERCSGLLELVSANGEPLSDQSESWLVKAAEAGA